jgi:hypothetical protein
MLPATEDEIKFVTQYMASQAPDLDVTFVQKVYSENILGHVHEVWDVHTNKDRWCLITNPMNLYSQRIDANIVENSLEVVNWPHEPRCTAHASCRHVAEQGCDALQTARRGLRARRLRASSASRASRQTFLEPPNVRMMGSAILCCEVRWYRFSANNTGS